MNNFLLNLLFPKICLGCKKEDDYLCNECKQTIQPTLSRVDFQELSVLSCYPYEEIGLLAKLVHLWKYDFVTDSELLIFAFLKQAIAYDAGSSPLAFFKDAVFCPVPLSKKRNRWRGFNQAEKLASMLGSITDRPVEDFLERTIDTKPQVELLREERLTNVSGAFAIKKAWIRANAGAESPKIILVDDVVTTGSTLLECAKILRQHFPQTELRAFVLAKPLFAAKRPDFIICSRKNASVR